MTKQEKIKEAYGENYNPHNIDENGWMKYSLWMHFFKKVDADYDEFDNRNMIVRPKSLKGIENNNGWIKIESEADLPKEDGFYWVIDSESSEVFDRYFEKGNHDFFKQFSSHYHPVIKPDLPLY